MTFARNIGIFCGAAGWRSVTMAKIRVGIANGRLLARLCVDAEVAAIVSRGESASNFKTKRLRASNAGTPVSPADAVMSQSKSRDSGAPRDW